MPGRVPAPGRAGRPGDFLSDLYESSPGPSGPGISREEVFTVPGGGTRYMRGMNMMWALGVPGNISQGMPGPGIAGSPVVSGVANGM